MDAYAGKLNLNDIDATTTVERRVTRVFFEAILLSALVVLNVTFLRRSVGAVSDIVRVSFPGLLLWSFVVKGHAFHCLSGVSAQRRQLLKEMTTTDPITGAKRPSQVKYLLRKQSEALANSGLSTSVLYVDLKRLNLVNQRFGFSVGDMVLKNVAEVIERNVAGPGIVGRVAGDEFIIVLPGTDSDEAKCVASVIERAINNIELDWGEKGRVNFLGCRIGVIDYPSQAELTDEVIGIARATARRSDIELPQRPYLTESCDVYAIP